MARALKVKKLLKNLKNILKKNIKQIYLEFFLFSKKNYY